jgi:hypothetical protein
LLPSLLRPVYAQSTDPKPQPDNTAVNKRDQNPGEVTADQQKMNAADRALTAKIRKAVIADKSLSTYAKATERAGGPDKVVNQMSVKP